MRAVRLLPHRALRRWPPSPRTPGHEEDHHRRPPGPLRPVTATHTARLW